MTIRNHFFFLLKLCSCLQKGCHSLFVTTCAARVISSPCLFRSHREKSRFCPVASEIIYLCYLLQTIWNLIAFYTEITFDGMLDTFVFFFPIRSIHYEWASTWKFERASKPNDVLFSNISNAKQIQYVLVSLTLKNIVRLFAHITNSYFTNFTVNIIFLRFVYFAFRWTQLWSADSKFKSASPFAIHIVCST